jgi:hypothetical protein
VIAALAGFVHDRQSAADYEHNHDNDSYYGSVHCNLPCELPFAFNLRTNLRRFAGWHWAATNLCRLAS